MIFKYELRFVAFTWPNLCLWVVILCPAFVSTNLKTNFCKKKPRFLPALVSRHSNELRHCDLNNL